MIPHHDKKLQISLVIPVKNEADSLDLLIDSINKQSRAPDEIIFVDGGSTDGTVEIFRKLTAGDARYRIIETGKASPGKGRNIGTENARSEWIAYTDAGIKLENDWLEQLVEKAAEFPEADFIYGNVSAVVDTLFKKCAMFAYVAPQPKTGIRVKFIASSLVKKKVWQEVGGFPDLRAAEDLMFMEAVEDQGFKTAYAQKAMVYWQPQPHFAGTFRRFVTYSKFNVWAGRWRTWHYGLAKQYLIIAPFAALAFWHSYRWAVIILLWLLARTAKRILLHKREFGFGALFNPLIFAGVLLIILTLDAATFVGWGQALLQKKR